MAASSAAFAMVVPEFGNHLLFLSSELFTAALEHGYLHFNDPRYYTHASLGIFFFFWLTNCVSASSRKKGWAPCGRCLLITVKRALPQLVLLKPDIDPSSHTLFTLHPPALQVVGSTPPNLWIWIVIVDSANRMFSRCITCLENRTVADRVSRLTSGAD